jgi:hypothetical protein
VTLRAVPVRIIDPVDIDGVAGGLDLCRGLLDRRLIAIVVGEKDVIDIGVHPSPRPLSRRSVSLPPEAAAIDGTRIFSAKSMRLETWARRSSHMGAADGEGML